MTGPLVFEGSTADGFETSLTVTDPTADRTITFPDADTVVAGLSVAQTWNASQKAATVTDNDANLDMSAAGNNYSITPAAAFTLDFTNIAANAGKSGYITIINATNYTGSAGANTDIEAADLTTISATGTHILPYLNDGTDVIILGVRTKTL
jgi:hypothetical protein